MISPAADLSQTEGFTLSAVNQEIRCVCGETRPDGYFVQCDRCGYWLHGACLCIGKLGETDKFECPFCTGQTISCCCNNNNDYSSPLIRCTLCGSWVHKVCNGIGYGRIPQRFVCKRCKPKMCYDVPPIKVFVSHNTVPLRPDSFDYIMENVPPGALRNMLVSDVSASTICIPSTVERYFKVFISQFMNFEPEFVSLFINSLSAITNMPRNYVVSCVDIVMFSFQYVPQEIRQPTTETFFSDYCLSMIDTVAQSDDSSTLVAYLSGDVLHVSEIKADNGIPCFCFRIEGTEFVIDCSSCSFRDIFSMKRSIDANCSIRLCSVGDELRVGLYSDAKTLLLPLDPEISYRVPRKQWKSKQRSKRTVSEFTLESIFSTSDVPVLPIKVISN